MDLPFAPIRYATVGGPPHDWLGLLIIDGDTGRRIDNVVEVNCDEGWLVRHVLDENDRPQLNADRTGVLTERIEGNFLIIRDTRRARA